MHRNASYGSYNIDNVVKEWKPTVWIGSNDAWSFPIGDYADKPWYKQINAIHHITIDSVPVIDLAFEQAKQSKTYLTWAKFAAKEMKRVRGADMQHVDSIYGAMDTQAFSPITPAEKAAYRKQFRIDDDTFIFLFVFRNQLRKSAIRILEAFRNFKKDNPAAKAKLHFHTSFSEKGSGWDIPKMMNFYGIPRDDVLCTYFCKNCGRWWVAPYVGEDVNCPFCRAEKSAITPSILHGVMPHEMKYIYGLSDACLSAFTSGGQEYHSVQSLLCGKPLACTNYSCGEDFCTDETKKFIYPLKYHWYEEMGTNFLKGSTDASSIHSFMTQIYKANKRDLAEIGERSRDWAIKNFSIDAIGAQWDALFDKLPVPNTDTIAISNAVPKNDQYAMPTGIEDNTAWIKNLYKNILNMDVSDTDDGLKHWEAKLKMEETNRDDIYKYFIQVARQENSKSGTPKDFWSMLDKTTGKKRALFIIKESIGDCLICTQLFEDFHRQYKDHDLYVMSDPKFAEIFLGNPYIFKWLPYLPAAESELAMTGAGHNDPYFHVYFHAGILTQRQLFYLSPDKLAFELST